MDRGVKKAIIVDPIGDGEDHHGQDDDDGGDNNDDINGSWSVEGNYCGSDWRW